MAKVLFTNVRVLDCTGAEPYSGQVLVEGNEIKQVAKTPDSVPADGARVIDGAGSRYRARIIPFLRNGQEPVRRGGHQAIHADQGHIRE